jgi:protocatechuate 3,4-dioxygenase beta subunit
MKSFNRSSDEVSQMKSRSHGDGLAEDLRMLEKRLDRRQVLGLFAGASVTPLLLRCARTTPAASPSGGDAHAGGSGAGSGSCAEIPQETGGPYPGDGTNGPNMLALDGIIRSDIRTSFSGMSGTAAGVPLTVRLTLVDTTGSCAPMPAHAVYIWHCDRDAQYSLYTIAERNYLRGVQEADENGTVTFASIFPGCYSGRWPHIHFEVFESVDRAMSGANALKTSQLAIPKSACDAAYQTDGYASSVANLAGVSLTTDMVFSDGATLETPAVSGYATDGYVLSLRVGINS